MSQENQHTNLILFEDFIGFLRNNGYPVGVDTHLKMQRLLEELSSGLPAERLKTLLAPIFVNSTEQQDTFYRLFDDFLESYQAGKQVSTYPDQPLTPAAVLSPPSGMLRFLSRRRYYLMVQAILILGLGYLGVQGIDCYIKTGNIQATSYCLLGINNPFYKADTLGGMEVNMPENPDTTTYANVLPEQDSLLKKLIAQLPLEKSGLIREDISDLRAGLYQQYGPLLKMLLVVAIITAFFFYESYWYNRKKLFLLKERGKMPPYVWTIHTSRQGFHLYTEQKFFEASRRLREREPGETKDLNVDKSISRTVEKGGFPSPEFDPRSRPPEYLVLIEKHSARDHQAMLFDQLMLELAQQDIYIERYFYEQDPRLCWKERYVDEIFLEELYRRFPDNRVIVIGYSEPFFDPVTDRLADWTVLLKKWKQVALVSPKCPLSWGHREVELSRNFIFLPATTEALGVIVDIFNQNQPPPLRYWIEQNHYPIPPDPESPELLHELEIYFDTYYSGRDESYEAHGGKYSFTWLCACAVYPNLSWDLTLAIGEAISDAYKVAIVNPQTLYKLVSLIWFREGEISDDLREKLIARLQPREQVIVRQTLVRILRENPPPTGSYAEAEHQLNIAIQEAELKPSLVSNLRMIQQAQTYSLNHEIRDKTVIRSLKSLPEATLKFSLPGKISDWLFRQGIPALGLRTWVRATTALATVMLIILSLDPSRLDRVHTFSGERYFLENSSSRMRFHTYVGNAYFDSLNFAAARENYQMSLILKKEANRRDYLTPDFNLTYLTWEEGNTEEAREEFGRLSEKAADLQQDNLVPPQSQKLLAQVRSEAEYNQGIIYYRTQRTEAAEEQFRDAVKADSTHTDALYAEAILLLQKGLSSSGANQQNSLNLSFNRVDDLLSLSPDYFEDKKDFVSVLDSVNQYSENALIKDRIQLLISAIEGKTRDSLPEMTLIVDSANSRPEFPPQLKYITDFIEGLALVEYQGKYGFIDTAANLKGIKYQDARPFSEGRAAVRFNHQWGFINKNLETVIPFRYDNARDFINGRATVKSVGKWGVVDLQGKTVVPFDYESPIVFENEEGLPSSQEPWAVVFQNGKYQYIDKRGNVMLNGMRFQYAENFTKENRAWVKRYEKKFTIDREGNCVPSSLAEGKCPTEKWEAKLTARLTGHEGPINVSLYAPNGSYLVTASADGSARVWNTQGNKVISVLSHGGTLHTAAVSPDSRFLATGSENRSLKIWHQSAPGAWELLRTLEDARGGIWSVAFSADSRFVAAGAADQAIRIYEVTTGKLTTTLTGHTNGAILALSFSPDGRMLVSGGEDESVRLWNWKSGLSAGTLPGRIGEVLTAAFSPDGRFLALGTRNKLAKIYEMSGSKAKLVLQLDTFEDWVSGVTFSPNGKYLLTTSFDNRVRVFNLDTREIVLNIRHPGTVRSAAFSPDGKYILTASWGESGHNRASVFEIEVY
ncbi:MAG: WG repeat-containing protein [Bacteroidia bacterium]|nr:WG repeat-containing protein [Bacteroidia bacterium]